jgi:hypothetical protein
VDPQEAIRDRVERPRPIRGRRPRGRSSAARG